MSVLGNEVELLCDDARVIGWPQAGRRPVGRQVAEDFHVVDTGEAAKQDQVDPVRASGGRAAGAVAPCCRAGMVGGRGSTAYSHKAAVRKCPLLPMTYWLFGPLRAACGG